MLHTSDFDFELPPELIASHPLARRDASRMLVVQSSPPLEGCPHLFVRVEPDWENTAENYTDQGLEFKK